MNAAIRVFGLIALAFLSGCEVSDSAIISSAESAVSSILKDPSSGQFSGEFLIKAPPGKDGYQNVSVCGFVNAKNSFGAYAGASRFVVSLVLNDEQNILSATSAVIDDGKDQATLTSAGTARPQTVFEAVYWDAMCVDGSHPATYTGLSND